jgi:hypothetical protein
MNGAVCATGADFVTAVTFAAEAAALPKRAPQKPQAALQCFVGW